jgi:VanZ family protein
VVYRIVKLNVLQRDAIPGRRFPIDGHPIQNTPLPKLQPAGHWHPIIISMGSSTSPAIRRILNWLPAAIAVAVIACESTVTMGASNTSRWLLPIWVHLFGPITPARWNVVHHYIRKTGHFTGYGLVSLAFFHGWRTTLSLAGRTVQSLWRSAALLAISCTLLIASADEFHQSFLPGRTSSPYDVCIDVSGAILMQLIVLALMPALLRSSREKKPITV